MSNIHKTVAKYNNKIHKLDEFADKVTKTYALP